LSLELESDRIYYDYYIKFGVKTSKPMTRKILLLISIANIFIFCLAASDQNNDRSDIKINTRLSFYSSERNGEFLLEVPVSMLHSNISLNVYSGAELIVAWDGKPNKSIQRVPFQINLIPSSYKIQATLTSSNFPGLIYKAFSNLIILRHKPNEVKTDFLTGGLIVNNLPFFPFGFYCYSPVYPTLPEEEVVKGFNMMSPYQKIAPETIGERRAYMDRCAELGMKVHYNLLSVSGGGGVASKIEGLSDEEKRIRLISEISEFKDHPALLAWYISDEPNGHRIPPETLDEIYRVVKENDPWHPVSIVFTAPYMASKKYSNAMDIIMADPYPLPELPVSFVGDLTSQLKAEFDGKKPLWIVPQAFGGGEIWTREPTIQEIRSMTWQAVINGATGIQYFVRQGLNYFPKSAATWGECGRISMEIAEITPWLLSDEETFHTVSNSSSILTTSRMHNGQLLVMSVNKKNEPLTSVIRINGVNNASARLIFENRSVQVRNGIITEHLAPFGSQVYLINLKNPKTEIASSNPNLLMDPGFEDISSPGIPSACYSRPGGDRGATGFLDSRVFFEGNHSLRITTPKEDKSLAIRFFPFSVKAGSSYIISLWAKTDTEMRFKSVTNQNFLRLLEKKELTGYVEISLGDFGSARFSPDNIWRRYVTFITIPSDTLEHFKTNLILKMPGQGVAWFDEIKVSEEKR
jgi:hypothetical protein